MSNLKEKALAAIAEIEEWKEAGENWPQWNRRYLEFRQEAKAEDILALVAENETIKTQFDECARLFVDATEQACKAQRERDELTAEVAGLRTGYQAYERVNAELKAEVEALRKDAERWRFFSVLANDLQAFPHSWGQMTPEKMDFMCDEAMADAAIGHGEQS